MFYEIDKIISIPTKMDTLPLEIVDHIANYLNKSDLVNYAMSNSEYNNLLSKRVAYEKEKMKFDKYINHNRLVTQMYINDKQRQCHKQCQYYKCCIICGREVRNVTMTNTIVLCCGCNYRLSENIKEKIVMEYERNTCDCIMREIRMMILNNVDESTINEMFTLETRPNFNHDEGKLCLDVLYSLYSPCVIKFDEDDE